MYELEFPGRYDIRDPRIDVMIGSPGQVTAEDEVARLTAEKALMADKVFDTWRLGLRVRNPLFGHNYAISYVPPRGGWSRPDGP